MGQRYDDSSVCYACIAICVCIFHGMGGYVIEYIQTIDNEIVHHIDRWLHPVSYTKWESHVGKMKESF